MSNNVAPRDGNFEAVIQGVSSLDFISTTNIAVNPSTHAMLVEASITPSGTQDVNLTEVGGSAFSLGQQLAASSLPVVLTAAQITTLTPLSTITVNQGTSPWVVSLTSTTITGTVAATQSGTWNIGTIATITNPVAVTGTFFQTTQPVSMAVAPLISSVIVGQKKITSSAVQLGSNALTNGVIFTALSTNTGNIFIGGSSVNTTADGTGNGYILEPGNSVSFTATNTNLYYVIGTANDVLSFAGA